METRLTFAGMSKSVEISMHSLTIPHLKNVERIHKFYIYFIQHVYVHTPSKSLYDEYSTVV